MRLFFISQRKGLVVPLTCNSASEVSLLIVIFMNEGVAVCCFLVVVGFFLLFVDLSCTDILIH